MKKILGISLVALFAVAPMMAKADIPANANDLSSAQLAKAALVSANTQTGEIGDAKKVAAVSFVKGAYSELATAINKKQDKLTAGTSAIDTAVVQSAAIHEATTSGINSASDTALVTERAVLKAINAADSAMNTRVTGLETAVGDSSSGLVKQVADLESAVNDTQTGLATKASSADLTALGTRVETAEGKITTLTSTDSTVVGSVAHAEASAAAAASAASNAATAANAAQQSANTALASFSNYTTTTDMNTLLGNKVNTSAVTSSLTSDSTNDQIATAKAVYDADKALGDRIDGITTNYATKTGVESTITNATYALSSTAVTGSAVAMTEWGEATTGTIAVTGNVTNAAVSATAATYPN